MPGSLLGELLMTPGQTQSPLSWPTDETPTLTNWLSEPTATETNPTDVALNFADDESPSRSTSPASETVFDPVALNPVADPFSWLDDQFSNSLATPTTGTPAASPDPTPVPQNSPTSGNGGSSDPDLGGLSAPQAFSTATFFATDDYPDTTEELPVTFDPLSNDTFPTGITPTITNVGIPAHGTAALGTDGRITYTPTANYNGPDEFTYTISDGQGTTSTATIRPYVSPVNDAPVANNDSVACAEDTEFVTVNVTANDTDIDSDQKVITEVTHPANGYAFNNNNGTVKYVPNGDFNGTDSFTYTIADMEGGYATATVNIYVSVVGDVPVVYDELLFASGIVGNTGQPGGGPSGGPSASGPPGPFSGNVLANDINYDQAYFNSQYNAGLVITNPRTITTPQYTFTLQANGDYTLTNMPVGADINFLIPYTVSNGFGIATANAHVRILQSIPAGFTAPTAVEDKMWIDARGDTGNVLTNDTGATYAYVVTPPRFSRLQWSTNGSYTLVGNAHRTAGNELITYMNADGNKIPGATKQNESKEVKITLTADILKVTAPKRIAGDRTTVVNESGARQDQAQKSEPTKAYVHFNVDNDDLRIVKAGEQGVPKGILPSAGAAGGYVNTGTSLGDYLKEDKITGEDDLLKVTENVVGHDEFSGTYTVSRSTGDMRVWLEKDKQNGPRWQWTDANWNYKTLNSDATLSYDLSNTLDLDVMDRFSRHFSNTAYIEGFGDEKAGSKKSIYSVGYAPVCVGETKAEIEYVFFALNNGRQPKPVERSTQSLISPNLIHCEWSIMDEPNIAYNCFAWAGGETDKVVAESISDIIPIGSGVRPIPNVGNVNVDIYDVYISTMKLLDYLKSAPIKSELEAKLDDLSKTLVVLYSSDAKPNEYLTAMGAFVKPNKPTFAQLLPNPLLNHKEIFECRCSCRKIDSKVNSRRINHYFREQARLELQDRASSISDSKSELW